MELISSVIIVMQSDCTNRPSCHKRAASSHDPEYPTKAGRILSGNLKSDESYEPDGVEKPRL
jgi:hypothetical protein